MADRVGQLLGNYQLTKLLGQGGFAEVYLGKHIYLKTLGAIKLLHTKGANQKELDDFFKEAQAIARLRHPNIIRVLEFGMEEKIPFLVMDYAPYGTLRQRHPKKTQVPLETVLAYVKQVAAALQYAHNAGIIHRDVKPDNMLLGEEDSLWLSDFGIALTAHNSTAISTQDAIGTIAYMAPEQFQGKPRRASDQYALGLVVYEWLTGERPFYGSFAQLGMQHMHAIPAPLREKVPTLGADVEKVVLRALAKDPQERYGSVEEFAQELERTSRSAIMDRESSPLYQKAALRIPRRTILKRVEALAHFTKPLPPTLPAAYQAMLPTTTLPEASGLIQEGKLQAPRRMDTLRTGLFITCILLVVGISLLYPRITATPSAGIIAYKPTPYDVNALANGMMFGYDAAHTRVNAYEKTITPENVHNLKTYWTAELDGQISTPAVVDGIVYVSSSMGTLYAFKADCSVECKPLWKGFLDQATNAAPAVAGGVVYVGSGDYRNPHASGFLYAFSAHGCNNPICKPLWRGDTHGQIYSSPTIVDKTVYISSSDGNLYVFKASASCDYDCAPKWMDALKAGAYDTPAVSGKFIYVGDNGGRLYAFNVSGCGNVICPPSWTTPTGGPISGSIAVANGFIYTGSTNNQTDNNLHVFNVSCATQICNPIRVYPTGKSIASSPAINGPIVYVGSNDGYLYAFSAGCQTAICGYLWRAATGGAISYSSPTVANGVVFIGSEDFYIYAFRASSSCANPCVPLWKFDMQDKIHSSPVVANGVVYVGSQDRRVLYAFHLPGATA